MALIRTPLGDCAEPRDDVARDLTRRPGILAAREYFGMDEGAYSPATTADMNWLMSCDLRCEPSRAPFLRRVPRGAGLTLTAEDTRSTPPAGAQTGTRDGPHDA